MADISTIERTFVLGSDGVTYFEVTKVTYDDETYTETSKMIGPASVLANHYADDFIQQSATLANNAAPGAFARRGINEIKANDTDILAAAGVSPLTIVQQRYEAELLTPGWTINQGAGDVSLVFSVNGQGVLKYSIDGAPVQNADMYGHVIQLRNYPTNGVHTEFFEKQNGRRFFALPNQDYIIKRP